MSKEQASKLLQNFILLYVCVARYEKLYQDRLSLQTLRVFNDCSEIHNVPLMMAQNFTPGYDNWSRIQIIKKMNFLKLPSCYE